MKGKSTFTLLRVLEDFTVWTSLKTAKFPRSHRYSYSTKIESILLETMILVDTANREEEREVYFKKIDNHLHSLRLLFRLSYRLKFIEIKSYEFAIKELDRAGQLLGGWWRSYRRKRGNG